MERMRTKKNTQASSLLPAVLPGLAAVEGVAAQRPVLGGHWGDCGRHQGDLLYICCLLQCFEQVVNLVRSELEASGVNEEAREKLLAGLKNAIQKAEKEKRGEDKTLSVPTLKAPGRNQMVSSKLAVKVSEGAAMRYVVATDDIKAGEVGSKFTGFSKKAFKAQVVVEEMPIAAVLVPNLLQSHCSTCLRPAIAGN